LIRAGVEGRLRQAAADRGDEIDVTELNEAVVQLTIEEPTFERPKEHHVNSI
jgi:hypothetical protein